MCQNPEMMGQVKALYLDIKHIIRPILCNTSITNAVTFAIVLLNAILNPKLASQNERFSVAGICAAIVTFAFVSPRVVCLCIYANTLIVFVNTNAQHILILSNRKRNILKCVEQL